jgi:GDP/UDP-N,N'-diacetylbacillosamine 2-epimerase (hydrolysing)
MKRKSDFRKICVVTSSRADYGLLKSVISCLDSDPKFNLQLIATGMHLLPKFGNTYKEIETDGFKINHKIKMLSNSDTAEAIIKSMGKGSINFADVLVKIKPDLIIVLGDRFEILTVASSALIASIPIAHLHGGESTEGLIDEAIRHSITKMSHLHFVATENYRKKVIQLGEQPNRVFNVGGLGVDRIKNTKLLKKKEIEKILNFKFANKNLLVTFHPVTLEKNNEESHFKQLLLALKLLKDTNIIFTLPNADKNGQIIIKLIKNFVRKNLNAKSFSSLGQLNYLSCIQFIDGVIGNSSSGLLEVPTFKKGTINIGERQKGRTQASSIINCKPERRSIELAIKKLYSKKFKLQLRKTINPYGNGGATKKIIKAIKNFNFDGILKKEFYNLD